MFPETIIQKISATDSSFHAKYRTKQKVQFLLVVLYNEVIKTNSNLFFFFVFFAMNSSHFVSDYFLVEQSLFEFVKLRAIFTPFAVLHSLPSSQSIVCIFDLNLTNSPIIFSLNSSFILPITFYWSDQKTLNLLDSY